MVPVMSTGTMECMRLRVKDLDFGHHQIIVRDAKGGKDRLTILPDSVIEPLRAQLAMAEQLQRRGNDCTDATNP